MEPLQIAFRLLDPKVSVFETMGIAGLLNLGANAVCLWPLTPCRHGDIDMASTWEWSRNDLYEGLYVLVAAGGVSLFAVG